MEFCSKIAWFFPRSLQTHTVELLDQFPAVVLFGPRQVGKTTLALADAMRLITRAS